MIKNQVTVTLRVIYSLMLIVFGLNGFIFFMPYLPFSPMAVDFLSQKVVGQYMSHIFSALFILFGLLLILNFFVSEIIGILTLMILAVIFFYAQFGRDLLLSLCAFSAIHFFLIFQFMVNKKTSG